MIFPERRETAARAEGDENFCQKQAYPLRQVTAIIEKAALPASNWVIPNKVSQPTSNDRAETFRWSPFSYTRRPSIRDCWLFVEKESGLSTDWNSAWSSQKIRQKNPFFDYVGNNSALQSWIFISLSSVSLRPRVRYT